MNEWIAILSQVFEYCVLCRLRHYPATANNQFTLERQPRKTNKYTAYMYVVYYTIAITIAAFIVHSKLYCDKSS